MGQSWSGLRKELEQDFICDKLKGRIQYFLTHYHGAPDNYGRIAVRVDGKEVLHGNPYSFGQKYYDLERQLKLEADIPNRVWTDKEVLYDEENNKIEEMVVTKAINDGVFEIYNITDSIRTYKNQSIDKSMNSENPIIRMFAIMDKRVGKRTLQNLVNKVETQPKWLQYFYRLRLEAENIIGASEQ